MIQSWGRLIVSHDKNKIAYINQSLCIWKMFYIGVRHTMRMRWENHAYMVLLVLDDYLVYPVTCDLMCIMCLVFFIYFKTNTTH